MTRMESFLDPARAYRAYHLDGKGRIRTFSLIEADNEAGAIEQARVLARKESIELWQKARFIVLFPQGA